jgi:NAD(P) transhydrogenase subunit alpha
MVEAMRPGSVVVDLAADQGGNCELSEPGVDVKHGPVVVRGMTNPASSMPTHASFLYARNVANFLGLLVVDGELRPDPTDEILVESCVTRGGEIVHAPTLELLGQSPKTAAPPAPVESAPAQSAPQATGDKTGDET